MLMIIYSSSPHCIICLIVLWLRVLFFHFVLSLDDGWPLSSLLVGKLYPIVPRMIGTYGIITVCAIFTVLPAETHLVLKQSLLFIKEMTVSDESWVLLFIAVFPFCSLTLFISTQSPQNWECSSQPPGEPGVLIRRGWQENNTLYRCEFNHSQPAFLNDHINMHNDIIHANIQNLTFFSELEYLI